MLDLSYVYLFRLIFLAVTEQGFSLPKVGNRIGMIKPYNKYNLVATKNLKVGEI